MVTFSEYKFAKKNVKRPNSKFVIEMFLKDIKLYQREQSYKNK